MLSRFVYYLLTSFLLHAAVISLIMSKTSMNSKHVPENDQVLHLNFTQMPAEFSKQKKQKDQHKKTKKKLPFEENKSDEKHADKIISSNTTQSQDKSEKNKPKILTEIPEGLRLPPPDYPPIARRWGYEGVTLLKITISENGRVVDTEMLRSSGHKILDDHCRKTVVNHWRFPENLGPAIIKKEFEFKIKR